MNLTQQQIAIVQSRAKKIKMTAVAGSGKTTTLKAKIKADIERGGNPDHMCVMTFTNKAAAQLKEMVPLAGTYHSVYYKLLRRFKEGFSKSIIPARIQDEIVSEIMKHGLLSNKSKKAYYETVRKHYDGKINIGAPEHTKMRIIYKEYLRYLNKVNMLDYDMIEHEMQLMLQDPDTAQALRKEYNSVYVDEFQDTNPIEGEILKLWNPERLFVVGDAAQNIYTFRGTTVANIMEIEVDESYMLSKTFRCPDTVTALSNRVLEVAKIPYHPEKMESGKVGSKVEVLVDSTYEIAQTVNKVVQDKLMIHRPDDIAILCRYNRQVQQVSDMADYPLSVISKQLMWDTKVGTLITQFLALCVNPKNNVIAEHFLRGSNIYSGREVDQLVRSMRYNDVLLQKVEDEKVVIISHLVKQNVPVVDKIARLFELFPLSDLYNGYELESQEKAQKNCIDAIAAFNADGNEEDMLTQIAEEDALSLMKENGCVKAMTIHAAKGLEFDVVIIPWVGIGDLPSNKESMEEELRLMYVAFTRAVKQLVVIRKYQPDRADYEVEEIFSEAGTA